MTDEHPISKVETPGNIGVFTCAGICVIDNCQCKNYEGMYLRLSDEDNPIFPEINIPVHDGCTCYLRGLGPHSSMPSVQKKILSHQPENQTVSPLIIDADIYIGKKDKRYGRRRRTNPR